MLMASSKNLLVDVQVVCFVSITELPPRSAVWFKVLSGVLVPLVPLVVMLAAWLSCRYKTLKNKEGECFIGPSDEISEP